MSFNPDNIRLEIEVPGEGLPNLIKNTDGEKGPWGWVTPLTQQVIGVSGTVDGNVLTFNVLVGQSAAYLTTVPLPAVPGYYYSARINLIDFRNDTGDNVKPSLVWYDASKTQIGTTGLGAAWTALGVNFFGPSKAPANAAYVALRMDYFNGTTPGGSGTSFSFNQAMLTYSTTGVTAPFDFNNSSVFENILGSTANINVSGTVLDVKTLTATVIDPDLDPAYYPQIRPGKTIRLTANSPDLGTSVRLTADPTAQSQVTSISERGHQFTVSQDGAITSLWYYISNVGTAFTINIYNYDTHELIYSVAASTVFTSGWRTQTIPALDLKAGTKYVITAVYPANYNVPYHSSFLTGSVTNGVITYPANGAVVFPSPGTLVAPTGANFYGIGFGFQPITDKWLTVYTGTVDTAKVVYDTRVDSHTPVTITVTAMDNTAKLAQINEPRTVGTVEELPELLESASVPWKVKGNYIQVGTATVIARDPNKTLLDQIALLRDTYSVYAWVDRTGVLNVNTHGASLDVDLHLTDVPEDVTGNVLSYSDMPVSFGTDECINSVTLNVQTYDGTAGQIIETVYTYDNTASIYEWGRYNKPFTVAGYAGFNPATFANAVLAANSQPALRVDSATIPVLQDSDIHEVAQADFYNTVYITNSDKFSDSPHLITSINHDIGIRREGAGQHAYWDLTIGFGAPDSVAAPATQPATGTQGTASTNVTAVGNILIQYGATTVSWGSTASGGSTSITFPKAFGSAPSVQTTVASNSQFFLSGTGNLTASGCTITGFSKETGAAAASITVQWVAIGPA